MNKKMNSLLILVLLTVMLPAAPVQADDLPFRYVDVCDEAHLLSALQGGAHVFFNCSGTIILSQTITLSTDTIIEGGGRITISGNNQVRVFVQNGGTASLNGLIIENGYVDPCGADSRGAGVLVLSGVMNTENTTVTGNNALVGAAFYSSSNSRVQLNYSTISGNTQSGCGSTKGQGGGVYVEDGGLLTAYRTSFSGNTNDGAGGGVYVVNGDEAIVIESTFSANRSDQGGAIYSVSGTPYLDNSTFSGNSATQGGALYNVSGTPDIEVSIFSDNNAMNGGAIYNASGSPNVVDSTFSSNSATYGGGIYNASGSPHVVDSTFSGNSATNGGAIYNASGPMYVDGSTFSWNTADEGGGVYNNGELNVSTTSFENHDATWGAALYNHTGTLAVTLSTFSGNATTKSGGAIANSGVASFSGTTFRGNSAAYSGGAIWNDTGGQLTIDNSTFSENSSPDWGGGIYNDYGTASVSNSAFSNNNAVDGGAILNGGTMSVSSSTFDHNHAVIGAGIRNIMSLTVSNSTFSQNSADDRGGGISSEYAEASVFNSTFSGNSATNDGGAIYNLGLASLFQLANTIVANNTTGGNCSGHIIDRGGNLNYPNLSGKNCPGYLGDPMLGPLQANGGPTLTMALAPGSPATDAADDAICSAAPVNNLDQRGATRPNGPHCDIGAVEQEPTAGPAVIIDVKPHSDANSINCCNPNGLITVAVLTSGLFDATTIDHTTVTFQGAGEAHVDHRTGSPVRHEQDVDGDGDTDLVFHFRLGSTTLTCQSTKAALWGRTFTGRSIVGTDSVRMICGKGTTRVNNHTDWVTEF